MAQSMWPKTAETRARVQYDLGDAVITVVKEHLYRGYHRSLRGQHLIQIQDIAWIKLL